MDSLLGKVRSLVETKYYLIIILVTMHNERDISVISREIFLNFHLEPITIHLKKLTCSILLQFTFLQMRMKLSFKTY